ncbi:MAG: hypothetical protein ACXVCR_08505 [Bdellovibrio sp.]
MQNKSKITAILFLPMLLFNFQNCSKIGTSGIAVEDKSLTPVSVQTLPPNGTASPPQVTTPPDNENQNSNQDHETPDISDPNEPAPEIADSDVVEAIKVCKKNYTSNAAENLSVKFNHENLSLAAKSVSSIKGNHGNVLIDAAKDNAAVGTVFINHSTLILCNFSHIMQIKGPHNKIVVMGGSIDSAFLIHSTLSLVNASVSNVTGSHSIVKTYTLK